MTMARAIDYLREDPPIAGQKYFLKSVIQGPNGKVYEIIRYVCGGLDEAKRVAQTFRQQNDDFDVVLGEVGKWSDVLPTLDNTEDVEYQNQELQAHMKGYLENQRAAKDHFEQRKANVLRDGLIAHLEPDEVIPKGLPAPPPPIDERQLRSKALAEAETMHPAERAAAGLPEREDISLDIPVRGRASGWKAAGP